MTTDPNYDPSLPPAPAAGPAPLWVWLLVLVLGAGAGYAGYRALTAHQQFLEGESIRAELTQERDRLRANAADLSRQLERANQTRSEVEDALKQSKANTESASQQIADLQKQVSDLQENANALQQRVTEAEQARGAAEAGSKEAAAAKEAADAEIASLKQELAQTKKKLDSTSAELAKERTIVSPAPVGPPGDGQ